MKPTLVLRSFLLGSSIATLITSPAAFAGQIWDGGSLVDSSTMTKENWTGTGGGVLPTATTVQFAGSVRTTVAWDGINTASNINLTGILFNAGASVFNINAGTQSAVQFTSNSTATIQNNSSNLQTLAIQSRVFFNGTKTFDAGASNAGLALNGGILFRGDSMLTGEINRLDLIGTGNGMTANIGRAGTFAGTANTQLVKNGSGKWTITGNVTDTGTHTITQGTLEYQGSIASSGITNNAAMILSNAVDQSYANNIGGNGTLTKSGAGKFTLDGTNGYSGATNVTAGTLAVTGSLGNTTTTIGAGAPNTGTLQGSGTIAGSVTIANGGKLAPGNSIESLGTGALSFASGSTYAYELQTNLYAGTPNVAGDLTDSTGTLDITAGAILTLTELAANTALAVDSKLTLISYFGGWTAGELFTYNAATLNDGDIFTLGANEWRFEYDDLTGGPNFTAEQATGPTARFVTMTVVPEPGAALLGGLGMLVLLRRRQR